MELHQRLLLSMRRALLLGGTLLAAAGAAPAADFASLARLAGQGARVTALVWDLSTDQPLAQLEPAQRLTPASLSKVVIAAAALDTWPPDHTFATELRAAGSPVNGVVEGDLVLRSQGDATLDETTLWGLAAQLRALGVRRVTGRLLVERAPFGDLACDTVDRCNAMRRSARAYNATPSAIGVNYGSWCITVRAPAGAAARADVSGCATGELPVPLTGTVRIAAGGPALSVERNTGPQGDVLAVSGSIAPGEERSVHRAMSDPAAGAGLILRSILRQAGIAIDGGMETTGAAHAPRLLAKVDGLLLQEQVGRMMRWSNNYIADVLTMGVALKRRGTPPASLAAASGELLAYMARNGAAPGALMESGSGLTTGNRLSAQDLVSVLRAGYRDTRAFPALYGAFVVPGDASFAYLRGGNADWQRRVALKTGSLTEPVSVNGIAGYLRGRDGRFLAFAVIVNGSERLRQVPHERALAAARADIEALLARY